MPFGRAVSYREIRCQFIRFTEKAILIDQSNLDEPIWIARSRIHGGDDRLVEDWTIGDIVDVRIEEWICEANELDSEP